MAIALRGHNDLPHNFLGILEEGLPNLTNLRHLLLSGCGLSMLPKSLKTLSNLELLDLSDNKFDVFPEIITELESLRYLSINPEAINQVPENVSRLTNLELLAIASDKLVIKDNKVFLPFRSPSYTKLSIDDLYKFENIKRLELSGFANEELLSKIDFSRFKLLTELGLFACHLKNFPISILQLENLEWLDLGQNSLEDIPDGLFQLGKLRYLSLLHNKIKHIPKEICNLNFIEGQIPLPYDGYSGRFLGLDFRFNPVENVPLEIVDQGFGAIKSYLEVSSKVSFNSAKLMIVGRGRVGKTTLLKKLIDPQFNVTDQNEETTRGVDIKKWIFETEKNEKFEARIWDFGGQQNYHNPHQLFLTKKSLYILVWDALQEEDDSSAE
jgi:internalin A